MTADDIERAARTIAAAGIPATFDAGDALERLVDSGWTGFASQQDLQLVAARVWTLVEPGYRGES